MGQSAHRWFCSALTLPGVQILNLELSDSLGFRELVTGSAGAPPIRKRGMGGLMQLRTFKNAALPFANVKIELSKGYGGEKELTRIYLRNPNWERQLLEITVLTKHLLPWAGWIREMLVADIENGEWPIPPFPINKKFKTYRCYYRYLWELEALELYKSA